MRKLQCSEKREYRMRKDNEIENRRVRWRQTETRGCSSETSGAQHKEDKVETETRGCSSETSGAQHKEDKVETDRDERMQ